eukprot:1765028-Prymnesium_polylepis.1
MRSCGAEMLSQAGSTRARSPATGAPKSVSLSVLCRDQCALATHTRYGTHLIRNGVLRGSTERQKRDARTTI